MARQKFDTAINRFSETEEVRVNTSSFWAAYTSGAFVAWFQNEDDAIAHCEDPENGSEFNGQWHQDRFTEFAPGELFEVRGCIYVSNDRNIDSVGRIDDFGGEWVAYSPKPQNAKSVVLV